MTDFHIAVAGMDAYLNRADPEARSRTQRAHSGGTKPPDRGGRRGGRLGAVHRLRANDTHTCAIDWGDATSPTVVDPATTPCAAGHTYTAAGIYTVSATVTDDDGDSDSEIHQYVVVYDRDAVETTATSGCWGAPQRCQLAHSRGTASTP